MTITLTTGTNSVWLSLKEDVPIGTTSSNYKFTFTNESTNDTKVFYPIDLSSSASIWSNFLIGVGPVEDLSQSILTLRNATYNYTVELNSLLLEMGKVVVNSGATQTHISATRPIETVVYAKR